MSTHALSCCQVAFNRLQDFSTGGQHSRSLEDSIGAASLQSIFSTLDRSEGISIGRHGRLNTTNRITVYISKLAVCMQLEPLGLEWKFDKVPTCIWRSRPWIVAI